VTALWQRPISGDEKIASLQPYFDPVNSDSSEGRNHPQVLVGLDDVNRRLPAWRSAVLCPVLGCGVDLEKITMNPLRLLQ
jgi:hypothetical protein